MSVEWQTSIEAAHQRIAELEKMITFQIKCAVHRTRQVKALAAESELMQERIHNQRAELRRWAERGSSAATRPEETKEP